MHAQLRVARHAVAQELVDDVLDVVGGDGIAHARPVTGAGGVVGGHAHQLAIGVDHGTARRALVDHGVGLDGTHVVGGGVVQLDGGGAVDARDNTGGDRGVLAHGAAHRHNPRAHLKGVRVAELDGGQLLVARFDLEHGNVARRIGAHNGGVIGHVAHDDLNDGLVLLVHVVVSLDDVVVREDMALGVKRDARSACHAHRALRAHEGVDGAHRRQDLLGHALSERGIGVDGASRTGGILVGRRGGNRGALIGNSQAGGSSARHERTARKANRQRECAGDNLARQSHACAGAGTFRSELNDRFVVLVEGTHVLCPSYSQASQRGRRFFDY